MCVWGTDAPVMLAQPRAVSGRRVIMVDACIASQVQRLIDDDIETLGCCCGHGLAPASVMVAPASVDRARRLGADVRPAGEDGAHPSVRLSPGCYPDRLANRPS